MKKVPKIILFFLVFCLNNFLYAQNLKYNKSVIEKHLSQSFNSDVTLENVEIYNSTQIIKEFPYVYWDSVNNKKAYHTIEVPSPGVAITFVVHKDKEGAKFRSITYLPFSLFEKKTEMYFYEDRWLSGGIHFDTQGKSLIADDCIKLIINNIQYEQVNNK